ncbi:MAG: hypothetical protein HYT21_02965 [Candidatus Nealsonbacteria bacterium]|nr:hypothetical protein [Candidatus Nealsonbacteria bacterium]
MDAILERLDEIQERFREMEKQGLVLRDLKPRTEAGRVALDEVFSEMCKEQDQLCAERLELLARKEVLQIRAIWPGAKTE